MHLQRNLSHTQRPLSVVKMSLFVLLLVFSLFSCNFSLRLFHRGRGRNGNLGLPGSNNNISDSVNEMYFDQKLDHFMPSNGQTWKQRYFVNDQFYKPRGPFFLLISGEAEADGSWMEKGSWIDYAKKYNAYAIMLEHRFYGKSHPTADLSVKNLAYLSSEQALADLANFIAFINSKFNILPRPKWIVFGGSYAGALAAWMRLKYPHLVHAAVSSSGPLLALSDFEDYFKVVKESLESYNPACVSAIKNGTKQLSSKITDPVGKTSIKELFHLCDDIDIDNKDDISNLYESLAGNFAGIVQYNKDYRRTKSGKLRTSIDDACEVMMDESISEIERLAKVNELVLNDEEEKCLDFKYSKMLNDIRSVDWSSEAAEGMRQWTYQTCTEFGFFQSSDLESTKEMFGDEFPVDFFIKQCKDIYGVKFNENLLNEGIQRTNMIYGGLDDRADNVVYVQGSIDPWHVLGITHTLREGAPAIFINGTAHCADMYPEFHDPPQLKEAKKKIEKIIGKWLS